MPLLRSTRSRLAAALAAALVVVLLAAAVVVVRLVWARTHRTDLERALDLVPAQTLRASFTDWAAVRRAEKAHFGAHPTSAQIESFTSHAYDDDLSAASSIDDSAPALQRSFGFSPANAEWELYAQSRRGAAMVLQLPDDTDFDALASRLDKLGYQKPSSEEGVWKGGIDLVSGIDASISPELQYVALIPGQHLVVSSDTSSYAGVAARVASGHGDGAGHNAHVRDLAQHVGEPAAAVMWTGDFACADLAMSKADSNDQAAARAAVARAGGVTPLSGLVMAVAPDRTFTAAMEFEDADQAVQNLRPRARLAVGPAIGRSGDFADTIRLVRSREVGSAVLLTFRPAERSGYLLSALYDGPVLFATC